MTWILLPGMDGAGQLLAPFVAALPREDVAVLVRYPGNRILSWRELIKIVDESLPITTEFVLLAESFSGALALEVASRVPPPKRLKGLVLCASFAEPPMSAPVKAFLKIFGGILMRMPPPRLVIRHWLMEKGSSDESVDFVASAIRSVRGSVLADRLKIVCDTDSTARLEKVQVPTLVVGASQDKVVPRKNTEKLGAMISGAKVVWIEGPHLLLQARPMELLEAAHAFFKSG